MRQGLHSPELCSTTNTRVPVSRTLALPLGDSETDHGVWYESRSVSRSCERATHTDLLPPITVCITPIRPLSVLAMRCIRAWYC